MNELIHNTQHDVSDECLEASKPFKGAVVHCAALFEIHLKHFDLCLHFNTLLSLIHCGLDFHRCDFAFIRSLPLFIVIERK